MELFFNVVWGTALSTIIVILFTPQRIVDKHMATYFKVYFVASVLTMGIPLVQLIMEVL